MSYFQNQEFACKCGQNCLPQGGMADELLTVLETAREELGTPVHISSGHRCPRHNANVGGASQSYHTKGMAADVYSDHVDVYTLKAALKNALLKHGLKGGLQEYIDQQFVYVDTRGYWATWCYRGNLHSSY